MGLIIVTLLKIEEMCSDLLNFLVPLIVASLPHPHCAASTARYPYPFLTDQRAYTYQTDVPYPGGSGNGEAMEMKRMSDIKRRLD